VSSVARADYAVDGWYRPQDGPKRGKLWSNTGLPRQPTKRTSGACRKQAHRSTRPR